MSCELEMAGFELEVFIILLVLTTAKNTVSST